MSDEEEFFDVEDEGEDFHDANERTPIPQVAAHSVSATPLDSTSSMHTCFYVAVLPSRPDRRPAEHILRNSLAWYQCSCSISSPRVSFCSILLHCIEAGSWIALLCTALQQAANLSHEPVFMLLQSISCLVCQQGSISGKHTRIVANCKHVARRETLAV